MDFDEVVVKESPGLCRCCLSEGCYKELGTEYSWMSETEIYADMLLECFDVSISQQMEGPNGPNRLICEVCITRLRDACNFKKQVLESEKKFIDMVAKGEFRTKVMLYEQDNMKEEPQIVQADALEVEYLDELDFGDDAEDLLKDDDTDHTQTEDITVAPLPVKRGRGRPRKNPISVKPEKKSKIAKLEEKPRSSKSSNKDSDEDSGDENEQIANKHRRDSLRTILKAIIEHTTVMPFRWTPSLHFICFYCGATFKESSMLKKHTFDEHDDPKLNNILKFVTTRTATKLDVTHSHCKTCRETFEDFHSLLNHLTDTHSVIYDKQIIEFISPFKLSDAEMFCLHCDTKFFYFATLVNHVNKYHSSSKLFICEICGRGFVSKGRVNAHVKEAHNIVNKKEVSVMKSKKKGKKCSKCREEFSTLYMLKKHLAAVHDEKSVQFQCEVCLKVFPLSSKLQGHIRRVHAKERNIVCQICGFKVFSKDNLTRHMVKHSDLRPYECEFCKKTFPRKKSWEFHRRIHLNDKRYSCKVCGKSFVQTTSLKFHMRVHHSNDVEKWN